MKFADFVHQYALPARDPLQVRVDPPPFPAWKARWSRLMRRGPRRLAYLDSMFPWRRSGFRYREAEAILDRVPDAMFFSQWELSDPFPAPVYPLSEFPRLAVREGITDVYGVFLLFMAGLCGLRPTGDSGPHVTEGPDLWRFFKRAGIRVHGSIYPGGGFTADEYGIAQARALAERLATTFSHVPEIVEAIPQVTPATGAWTDTEFYAYSESRWDDVRRVVCLFAADAPPRKGIDVVLRAFRTLDPAEFRLHVVGPHEHRRAELPAELAQFHGWCSPEELRALHRRTHIFLSPVSPEPSGPPGSFQGVIDGFPTQSARDAMSSGCLLLSANPQADHRDLSPGVHYVDCAPDDELLRASLSELAADGKRMRTIARAGSERARERFDVRKGVAQKLRHMGLLQDPDVTDRRGNGRARPASAATS